MNERFGESGPPVATETQTESEAVAPETPSSADPDSGPATTDTPETPTEDPTVTKFKSCRWHATQDSEGAEYCSHRDVRPFAGVNGFTVEAWCPDCEFFKVRRTVKRRTTFDDDY